MEPLERHRQGGRPPVANLLLVTWAAGMLDALSYLRSGVFAANMTGNTVVLGLAIAGTERTRVLFGVVALSAFAAGALISAWLLVWQHRDWDWREDMCWGLGLELPFVVAFALLWSLAPEAAPRWISLALIATAACGLGIQSVAVRRLQISGVVTTFITGTLTTAMVSLFTQAQPERQEAKSPALLGSVLVCYVLAAASAAALAGSHKIIAALFPVAAIGAAHVWSFLA